MSAFLTARITRSARPTLAAQSARLPGEWDRALTAISSIYLSALQAATPVGQRSTARHRRGTLRASWRMRQSGRGLRQVRTLSNLQPYLGAVVRRRGFVGAAVPVARRAARRQLRPLLGRLIGRRAAYF